MPCVAPAPTHRLTPLLQHAHCDTLCALPAHDRTLRAPHTPRQRAVDPVWCSSVEAGGRGALIVMRVIKGFCVSVCPAQASLESQPPRRSSLSSSAATCWWVSRAPGAMGTCDRSQPLWMEHTHTHTHTDTSCNPQLAFEVHACCSHPPQSRLGGIFHVRVAGG